MRQIEMGFDGYTSINSLPEDRILFKSDIIRAKENEFCGLTSSVHLQTVTLG